MAGAIHLGDVGNVEWSEVDVLQYATDDCSDDDNSSASDDDNAGDEIRAVDYTPVELLHSHRSRTSTSRLQSGDLDCLQTFKNSSSPLRYCHRVRSRQARQWLAIPCLPSCTWPTRRRSPHLHKSHATVFRPSASTYRDSNRRLSAARGWKETSSVEEENAQERQLKR